MQTVKCNNKDQDRREEIERAYLRIHGKAAQGFEHVRRFVNDEGGNDVDAFIIGTHLRLRDAVLPPQPPEWNVRMQHDANTDGWGVWYDYTKMVFEVEAWDQSKRFLGDDEALDYVKAQAILNSQGLHSMALAYVEYAAKHNLRPLVK